MSLKYNDIHIMIEKTKLKYTKNKNKISKKQKNKISKKQKQQN